MTSSLEMEWDYSGRKGDGMDERRKIGKANEKRKMGKVKKSKRWGGEWTRAGKRGKGCPAPRRAQVMQTQDSKLS